MVGKLLSLRRLLYAFFLFTILLCAHFLISVKRLPETVGRATGDGKASTARITTSSVADKRANQLSERIRNATQRASRPADSDALQWFFKNGSKRPSARKTNEKRRIWPEEFADNDRIVRQLMYVPKDYDESRIPMKTIVLWHGLDRWVRPGQRSFLEAKCPVNRCAVTDEHSQATTADAILFKDHFVLPRYKRPLHQVWIIYLLECPHHTERFQYNDLINWTATYRRDSDIVTPYEKWVSYAGDDEDNHNDSRRHHHHHHHDEQQPQPQLQRNFATNKTHQVAWFVSNCNARNGRLNYAHELQKHISVDIYGFCGPLKCPRTHECFHLLDTTYKFYLAFENSNCIDYITEKFFVNGLQHNILPIVMGARPQDYAAVAPHHSYIHVDDFASPKQLAQYLLKLDNDDELYNSYFLWKNTGEFINTQFFCRLCAMLHDPPSFKSYSNLNKWWKNVDTCITSGPWHRHN